MDGEEKNFKYQNIISLPYQKSKRHTQMSLHDRAAQFAPFAALTGHREAMEETARITEEEKKLDAYQIEEINKKLSYIQQQFPKKIMVSVTYFKQDFLKEGGTYLTDVGSIDKIDEIQKVIQMDSGNRITMKQLYSIEIF